VLKHGRKVPANPVRLTVNYKEKPFSRCNHLENIFPF
jgi:hypothetical protein